MVQSFFRTRTEKKRKHTVLKEEKKIIFPQENEKVVSRQYRGRGAVVHLHKVIKHAGPAYPVALPHGPQWLLSSSHHVLIHVSMEEEDIPLLPIPYGEQFILRVIICPSTTLPCLSPD